MAPIRWRSLMVWLFVSLLLQSIAVGHDPETPYPLHHPPKENQVFHVPTGYLVSYRQMVDTVTDARIIYVAETHDDQACHDLQLTLLKHTHDRYPGKTVLAMEIFTRLQQSTLDQWVDGQLNEKEFLAQIGWYRLWGLDFDFYRPLLLFARQHQIPVIGLNAEQATVDAIKQAPVDQLPTELQNDLPQMDLADPYHRAVTETAFAGHLNCDCGIDGFHRAQALWEETMAETIAHYYRHPNHQGHHMIVAAGKQHICYGFGIPRRVFRRLPLSYQLIGVEDPAHATLPGEDNGCSLLPLQPFHYLVYASPKLFKPRGVVLGIRMKTVKAGVLITRVDPGSIAKREGLRAGDVLVKWGDHTLRETLDLKMLLKESSAATTKSLTLLRQETKLTLELNLSPPP